MNNKCFVSELYIFIENQCNRHLVTEVPALVTERQLFAPSFSREDVREC